MNDQSEWLIENLNSIIDLGIDIDNIKNRTISVLLLRKCDEKFI